MGTSTYMKSAKKWVESRLHKKIRLFTAKIVLILSKKQPSDMPTPCNNLTLYLQKFAWGPSKNDVTHLEGRGICRKMTTP